MKGTSAYRAPRWRALSIKGRRQGVHAPRLIRRSGGGTDLRKGSRADADAGTSCAAMSFARSLVHLAIPRTVRRDFFDLYGRGTAENGAPSRRSGGGG